LKHLSVYIDNHQVPVARTSSCRTTHSDPQPAAAAASIHCLHHRMDTAVQQTFNQICLPDRLMLQKTASPVISLQPGKPACLLAGVTGGGEMCLIRGWGKEKNEVRRRSSSGSPGLRRKKEGTES
jgi:hypothetical protein